MKSRTLIAVILGMGWASVALLVFLGLPYSPLNSANGNPYGPDPSAITRGDLHPEGGGDSDVDVLDALRTLKFAVGLVTPDAREQIAGDVNPDNDPDLDGDGDVDILDALRVLKGAVGLISLTSCGGHSP